jgi:HlyD family secretion protein
MRRIFGMALLGAALLGALVWALWPQPMSVDLGRVERGSMSGIITGQGVTRVRAPHAITAPIGGALLRAPVEAGDAVIAGESVIAIISPADPGLMDARARAQAEAGVAEAEAALALAETNLRRAETALTHARSELDRAQALAESGTIARRLLEDIDATHTAAIEGRDAAQAQRELARATLARAQAQLMGPETLIDPTVPPGECCVRLVAPVSGVVLEVTDQSARMVQPGSPILIIGDLADLEIELDLLSSDAVRVPPDARALIERWGGDTTLEARLRRVEPSAFTRVSALGIEEQRVRLRLDLLSPPDERPGLGAGFRVQVHLIIWEAQDVLRLPQAALFRQDDGWAVFTAREGRAVLTPVQIARQAGGWAEVVQGLDAGSEVVLYPASALSDGAAIIARAQ